MLNNTKTFPLMSDSSFGGTITSNNTECNTLILSFRTGYPVPCSSETISETAMDTPSRVSDQLNSLVKHAVIRREVKSQSDRNLVDSVASTKSSLDFDDLLDDEEDTNTLSGKKNHIKLHKQTGELYLYKCGKLGPYGSLLQILR